MSLFDLLKGNNPQPNEEFTQFRDLRQGAVPMNLRSQLDTAGYNQRRYNGDRGALEFILKTELGRQNRHHDALFNSAFGANIAPRFAPPPVLSASSPKSNKQRRFGSKNEEADSDDATLNEMKQLQKEARRARALGNSVGADEIEGQIAMLRAKQNAARDQRAQGVTPVTTDPATQKKVVNTVKDRESVAKQHLLD